jgi:hypothetical protein
MEVLMGKTCMNGDMLIAMIDYWRVVVHKNAIIGRWFQNSMVYPLVI